MAYAGLFPRVPGSEEAERIRHPETEDIARRIGVISPKRLYINDHPVGNPIAAFNPALAIIDGEARLYVRVIVGYYKYVSAIAEVKIPLDDIETGDVNLNYYSGRLVVYPSTQYDFWGTEDPRVYKLGDKLLMTYTGRTRYYFEPIKGRIRTIPVTAVRISDSRWHKKLVTTLSGRLQEQVITAKNAFFVDMGESIYFFHRLHLVDEKFYLVASKVDKKTLTELIEQPGENIRELVLGQTALVMEPARFEAKIGWATPPIRLGGGKILAFLHGVDKSLTAYRLFAAELEESGEGLVVNAVTPRYIMEPRTLYEVYGDRSYTIFPCGIWRLDRSRLLLSYGAADYMAGLAEISIDELLGLLDKGRIH